MLRSWYFSDLHESCDTVSKWRWASYLAVQSNVPATDVNLPEKARENNQQGSFGECRRSYFLSERRLRHSRRLCPRRLTPRDSNHQRADSMGVVAITGGASGIGLATAKLLVGRGIKVSIADISGLEEAILEIAQHASAPDSVYAQKVDVRDLPQVQAWIAATVKQFGDLDGAANIAGVYDYPKSNLWHEQLGIEKWDHVIGVNLTGTANCLHVELEHMASAAATGRKAKIVNMTSVAGFRARGGSPA